MSQKQNHQPKPWTMPAWMEPYRGLIRNTGGNPVEDLVNDHTTTAQINLYRAAMCISVKDQVDLLNDLYKRGHLFS